MKFKSTWIKCLIGGIASVCFASEKGLACEVLEKTVSPFRIFIKKDLKSWAFGETPKNPGLTLQNCSGTIQLVLGSVLPSPADFSSETWLMESATDDKVCSVKSGVPQLPEKFELNSGQLQTTVQITNQCLGLQLVNEAGLPLSLAQSRNCQVVSTSARQDRMVLQGDNCLVQLSQSRSRVKVLPIVLEKCGSHLTKKNIAPHDVDVALKLIAVSGNRDHVEPLSEQAVQVQFEDEETPSRYTKEKAKGLVIKKASSYALDFDLAQLRLEGSPDTGLFAQSQFFVSQAGRSHIPFVVRNSLFLLKAESSEELLLGNWYSGAIIPPNWSGIEGLSNLFSIAVTQENFKLNRNSHAIRKGDTLILVSRLESPNSGPQKFWKYAQSLLRRNSVVSSSGTVTNSSEFLTPIRPIDALSDIAGIEEIPEIGQLPRETQSILQRFAAGWPIRFDTFCDKGRVRCKEMVELEELTEVRASYRVEDADFELKLRPLRYGKSSPVEKSVSSSLRGPIQVQCF